ncbi:unnamed protein product [Prorocentrum cordatum]|uniref:Thioesterase domain-containing protein n=1 Tax=Prorocentrum cordatum TaxID=2364126 RepID=A0ABN9RZ23_9DINO|nr:unnamed protein product [Polarella glacialis]
MLTDRVDIGPEFIYRVASVAPLPVVGRAGASSRAFSAEAALNAEGYIQHAAKGGREALLGPFRSSGKFDALLRGNMECTSVGDGEVTCAVTVTPALQNNWGTMHGGASATLVDVLGTMALLARDPQRAGVSVEMSQTFLAPARGGETVIASGKVVKYGRSLGFTEVKITDGTGIHWSQEGTRRRSRRRKAEARDLAGPLGLTCFLAWGI